MGIEAVKRWHWIFLGALIGLALAYAWSSVGSSVEGYRAADSIRFEQELTLKDQASGQPFIKGIVIHPPEDSFDGRVNVVTYKKLAKDKEGRIGWLNKRLIAKIPYKPALPGAVPPSDNPTIQGYLQQVASQNNTVRFKYGWWLEPTKAMMLGCIGGMVVIGGIWPTLLNVMLGAGFGRKTDPEEEALKRARPGFDWASLLRRSKSSQPAGAHGGVSSGDQRHVQEVADAYARNLQPTGQGHGAAGATAVDEGPVRKLEAGPLEAAKPMPKPGDDDEIEVKGEYYPVLIHHKKHHDEQKPGETKPPGSPPPAAGQP
jgi:hypothetical protein